MTDFSKAVRRLYPSFSPSPGLEDVELQRSLLASYDTERQHTNRLTSFLITGRLSTMLMSSLNQDVIRPINQGSTQNVTYTPMTNESGYCFANSLFQVLAEFKPFEDKNLTTLSETFPYMEHVKNLLDYLREEHDSTQPINRQTLEVVLSLFCDFEKQFISLEDSEAFEKICPNPDDPTQIKQSDSGELLMALLRSIDRTEKSDVSICCALISVIDTTCLTDTSFTSQIREPAGNIYMDLTSDMRQLSVENFLEPKEELISFHEHYLGQHYLGDCPYFAKNDKTWETTFIRDDGKLGSRIPDHNNHKKTTQYMATNRTTGMYILPKRSFTTLTGEHGKHTTNIEFPLELQLPVDSQRDNIATFHLCGFIVHCGGMALNGHYVAYVKKEKGWFLFDDDKLPQSFGNDINAVIVDDTIQRNVALIFYNRVTLQ